MNALLRRAIRELATNARLRIGVWVLAGLLLVALLVAQAERLAEAEAAYAAQAQQLAAVEQALARRDWPQLLAAERAANGDFAPHFWQAESEGVAQAMLQAAVSNLVEELDLRRPRIKASLSEPVPNLPGVCRVQVELSTEYAAGGQLRLIRAVATHSPGLIAERMGLGRQNARIAMTLSAYFLPADAGSAFCDEARNAGDEQ